MKIKLGAPTLADDVARARAAREGLGPGSGCGAMRTAPGTPSPARAALAALAAFGLDYVEQPLAADDFEGFAELHRDGGGASRRGRIGGDGDRRAATVSAGAVDVMVLKPATLGGPARALEIAARARRPESRWSSRTPSRARSAQGTRCMAAAWGDPEAVHGLCTDGLFASDVAASVACPGGLAEIADAAGLGITP